MNSAVQTPRIAYVRRIFQKDVRVLRWQLLLLLLLALSMALAWLGPDQIKDGTYVYQLMRWFLPAAALLVAVPLINADPTGREFRFLLTRPVPGPAIGIAKALFLGLFIIIPCWLVLELDITCSGVPLSAADHLLLLLETAVRCGACLAALALCCIFLRKSIFVVIVTLVVVVGAVWWISYRPFFNAGPPYPTVDHVRLFRARAFLALAAFLAVSLVAIAARYRTRGFKAPVVVLAAAIPVCLLADLTPAGIAGALFDQSGHRSALSPEDLGRIGMTVQLPGTAQPGGITTTGWNISTGNWNGTTYAWLNQRVRIDGVKPPFYILTLGYHAVITLRSGKTYVSDYADSPAHGVVGGLPGSTMATLAGVKPDPVFGRGDGTTRAMDLLCWKPADLGGGDLTGAKVKGVITLEVRRAYLAGTMPLRSNAALCFRRSRYQITRIEPSDNEVHVEMEHYTVPLTLRGDLADWGGSDWNTPDLPQVLAVYRPFNEVLNANGQGEGNIGGSPGVHGANLSWDFGPTSSMMMNPRPAHLMNARPGRPYYTYRFPDGWTSGVELDFIGSDSCGQVDIPYEIDNINLSSDQQYSESFQPPK